MHNLYFELSFTLSCMNSSLNIFDEEFGDNYVVQGLGPDKLIYYTANK